MCCVGSAGTCFHIDLLKYINMLDYDICVECTILYLQGQLLKICAGLMLWPLYFFKSYDGVCYHLEVLTL